MAYSDTTPIPGELMTPEDLYEFPIDWVFEKHGEVVWELHTTLGKLTRYQLERYMDKAARRYNDAIGAAEMTVGEATAEIERIHEAILDGSLGVGGGKRFSSTEAKAFVVARDGLAKRHKIKQVAKVLKTWGDVQLYMKEHGGNYERTRSAALAVIAAQDDDS